jgi:hypothetical protein
LHGKQRKLSILLRGRCETNCRWATYKKPAAQTAHLVFADTKANAEKPKELFFANALTEIE